MKLKVFITTVLTDRIDSFFAQHSEFPLQIVVQDCCSEMTRLVANWLQGEYPNSYFVVLKGTNIQPEIERAHEVLAIKLENNILVIDPTIWQFFPKMDSIVVGEFKDFRKTFDFLHRLYGGVWQINEHLINIPADQVQQWESILEQTIKENIIDNPQIASTALDNTVRQIVEVPLDE